MPEGDTIFRAATALRKALAGARVVDFRSSKLGGRGPVGERIEEVVARGKNLLIRFEKGRTLRTHMMMHGCWHIYRAGEKWRMPAHRARVELHADNGFLAVCFSAPVVEWMRPQALADLGPDATSDSFDTASARTRLASRPQMRVEEALLDQGALAGVGNVIKCEALFICRIDPFSRVGDLPQTSLVRLVDECRALLLRNRVEGPRASRSVGPRMWVYGRSGKACLVCGEPIQVRRTARTTYFCPSCQRSGQSARSHI